MRKRDQSIAVTLMIFIITIRYVGISSASGPDLDTTNHAGDNRDVSSNSSLQNCSSVSHNTSTSTNNSSAIEHNITLPRVYESLKNDSTSSSFDYEKYASVEAISVLGVAVGLGVWSVVANSLPLAAIIKQEQLHTPAYILMANLAASDVLTGFTFMFVGSSVLYHNLMGTSTPMMTSRLRFSALLLSGLSSAYGLMALTAERYWFIVHGMTYVNNVTNDKCKVMIVLVWVWSALLGMLPYFDWNCAGLFSEGCLPLGGGLSYGYVVAVLVFVFIPMAAIILLNMGVLWCLWKQVNAIAAQEAAVGAEPSTSRKSAFTVVLITVVFLVGWLPLFSRMAMLTTDVGSLHETKVFVVLNSAINPVVYGFRLREVRRGVRRLFRCGGGNANLPVN
ncbi:PREDICTED: G-protein coupled receptor 12-like [Branchiostoma belcheri]|uniref:G-protein coupled receptor 12-like n=1 Tax=Branchiostoma belcheri TaxID=7741 RepID=A0A6P4YUQ4_BRABE|nr:PREDICTED: G-protein coupled receptor 12-like [Branchiostoma belcheri]